MKLASLRTGGRDGTLLVVNRRMTHAIKARSVSTMQAAIDDWPLYAPLLAAEFNALQAEARADAFPFDVAECASPFPRAYQFLDGSVYLHHMQKARAARGAEMPPNFETEPLMYQGMSAPFCDPAGSMHFPSEALNIDFEGEVAIVTDDVPMGTSAAEAGQHIKLMMLLNDFTVRAMTKQELPKQFGFLRAKPANAFSPVAITLDELGGMWDGKMPDFQVVSTINGKIFGMPNAAKDYWFDYPRLIAHACETRELCAGTIIGAGTVSNESEESGYGSISEAQTDEKIKHGAPKTPFLKFGDRLHVEAFDAEGHSIFGAIRTLIAPME